MKELQTNKVRMSGCIVTDFKYSNQVYGENFYTACLSVERTSGAKDEIVIMVSDRLIDVNLKWKYTTVAVYGSLRSYVNYEDNKAKVEITVFVESIDVIDPYEGADENEVVITATVHKNPIYRVTPLGRELTDLMVTVERDYGKKDFIPCICWGRNARFANRLSIGDMVEIEGRFQSREYEKKLSDTETVKKTAYELSVSRIKKDGV